MPTIPQQQTIVQYVASNLQTQYTFAFYAPLPTDIQVYYQASNATPVPASDILTLNVDYTVTYNADPTTGGYITLLFTATSGYYLTINRMVEASLTTNFSEAQTFNGANLDSALDRLLLLCQQNLNYNLVRNLSYVINTYLPSAQPYTQLPPLPSNYVWMGSGNGVIAAQIATIPSASALQSQLANSAPGTDGARIVGYYDTVNLVQTNVDAFLTSLQSKINTYSLQPGMLLDFAGTSAPTGTLLCDGSAISRTTYANLFAAIGTTWGIGDGTTTFNIPDFRRRVSVGSGGTGTAELGNAAGNVGGEESHAQTVNEMPSHDHGPSDGNAAWQYQATSGSSSYSTQSSSANPVSSSNKTITGSTGGGNPFNVIQPSAIVTKVIVY